MVQLVTNLNSKKSGFAIVEVLLASFLVGIFAVSFITAILSGRESTAIASKQFMAATLAAEGQAAVRNIRDENFSNLTVGTHGLSLTSNRWSFSGNSDTIGIFTRTVTIADVSSDTKSITVTITWPQTLQRNGTLTTVEYLTNWRIASVPIPWQNPSVQSSFNIIGGQDCLSIDSVGNYAYVVCNAGNPNFFVIDVTNPATPSVVGSLNLEANPLKVKVSGEFAYVASSNNSQELQIINVSNPSSPTQVGSFDASGNTDANSLAVSGNTVFLGKDSAAAEEFFAINVTIPSSPSLLGSMNLSGDVNDIALLGTNAYLASSDNSQEFKVINVSNPVSMSQIGGLDIVANNDGLSVVGFGSTVLLGMDGTGVNIINITSPSSPSLNGIYSSSDIINNISIHTGNNLAFLATNTNGAEFKILDISNLATPSLFSSLAIGINDDLKAVIYNSAKDRVFGVTSSNTQEFIVVQP